MMFAIKMLLALFLSGAIFLFTLYRLLGFRFRLTYKKLLLSIVLSFCISTPVHAVHHSYMGLSEHLWFDNLGIVVFAVLLACAAAGLRLLNEYDGKIKALLTGIFGPENDFDAILGGVNLAGVGANGKRVVQNLLEALTPILREGAERRLKAAADTAEREAAAARAARGAV